MHFLSIQNYAELLYSRKITGTEDGGSAPNSVIIFLIYSGGVRSYKTFTMLRLGISCQPSRIFDTVLPEGSEMVFGFEIEVEDELLLFVFDLFS